MHERAAQLIEALGLQAHPEGGYYREIYRSPRMVASGSPPVMRRAATTIYFLLVAGAPSRWHRLGLDEVWHHYEGDALELFRLDAAATACDSVRLGPVGGDDRPVAVVPAGCWQAARSVGAFSLAGCTVAPGFEFSDFSLLADHPAQAAAVRARFPALSDLL